MNTENGVRRLIDELENGGRSLRCPECGAEVSNSLPPYVVGELHELRQILQACLKTAGHVPLPERAATVAQAEQSLADLEREADDASAPAAITDLPDKHKRVMDLLEYGLTPQEVQAHLAVSEALVQRVRRDPRAQDYAEHIRTSRFLAVRELAEKLNTLSQQAVSKLRDILQTGLDDKRVLPDTQLRAALSVLDRHDSGHFVKQTKHEHTGTVTHVSKEDLERLEELRQEILQGQNAIEADYEVLEDLDSPEEQTGQ